MDHGKPSPRHERAALMKDEERARRMVRTWGFCSADADDITQEVLIALAGRRASFRVPEGGDGAAAWAGFVWGVVVRQVASFRRERERLRRGDEAGRDAAAPIVPSMEELMIAESPRALLHRALDTLEPPQAAVMRLHIEGVSVATVAARLEIPYGTAWTRFRYAQSSLRRAVHGWTARRARRTARHRRGAEGGA